MLEGSETKTQMNRAEVERFRSEISKMNEQNKLNLEAIVQQTKNERAFDEQVTKRIEAAADRNKAALDLSIQEMNSHLNLQQSASEKSVELMKAQNTQFELFSTRDQTLMQNIEKSNEALIRQQIQTQVAQVQQTFSSDIAMMKQQNQMLQQQILDAQNNKALLEAQESMKYISDMAKVTFDTQRIALQEKYASVEKSRIELQQQQERHRVDMEKSKNKFMVDMQMEAVKMQAAQITNDERKSDAQKKIMEWERENKEHMENDTLQENIQRIQQFSKDNRAEFMDIDEGKQAEKGFEDRNMDDKEEFKKASTHEKILYKKSKIPLLEIELETLKLKVQAKELRDQLTPPSSPKGSSEAEAKEEDKRMKDVEGTGDAELIASSRAALRTSIPEQPFAGGAKPSNFEIRHTFQKELDKELSGLYTQMVETKDPKEIDSLHLQLVKKNNEFRDQHKSEDPSKNQMLEDINKVKLEKMNKEKDDLKSKLPVEQPIHHKRKLAESVRSPERGTTKRSKTPEVELKHKRAELLNLFDKTPMDRLKHAVNKNKMERDNIKNNLKNVRPQNDIEQIEKMMDQHDGIIKHLQSNSQTPQQLDQEFNTIFRVDGNNPPRYYISDGKGGEIDINRNIYEKYKTYKEGMKKMKALGMGLSQEDNTLPIQTLKRSLNLIHTSVDTVLKNLETSSTKSQKRALRLYKRYRKTLDPGSRLNEVEKIIDKIENLSRKPSTRPNYRQFQSRVLKIV